MPPHTNPLHRPPRPPPTAEPKNAAQEESEEEDDYMTMALPTEPAPKESSYARAQREKREALARGRVKSKAELAAEEAQRREEAHARSLLETAAAKKSKGLAMMAKMGFKGGALGKGQGGVREPIQVNVKEDRGGIGMEEERRKRMREVEEQAEREGKRAKKIEEGEYRERVAKERELERTERQYRSAAKLAERLHDEKSEAIADSAKPESDGDAPSKGTSSSTPLKSVNVLWRGRVKARELAERDRTMRRDLEQSLSRLPAYEDDHEDADDRMAMGKDATIYDDADDLDDEDAELEEFEALEPGERLKRALEYLRREHRYCFWCKCAYPDEEMDGCPGATEEDHD